jgi:hypothetical protein
MVAYTSEAVRIWRKVAAIERQIAEATSYQPERRAQLEDERDELLIKLVEREGARDRRVLAARQS